MAEIAGSDVRFKINTGPVGTPVYVELSCEGEFTLTVSATNADSSSKCSDWNTNIPVKRGWSVSGSGYYSAGDAGVDEIRDNIMAGDQALIQLDDFNTDVYSGTLSFDSFELSTPHDGVVGFSFSGTGDGALTVA